MSNIGPYVPTIIGLSALFYIGFSVLLIRKQQRKAASKAAKEQPPLPFSESDMRAWRDAGNVRIGTIQTIYTHDRT